jgi:pimeloyl-ACP methyl ester carboxylesterase
MLRDSVAKGEAPSICLLPGMAADYPIYSRLMPLLANASVGSFINPLPNESLIAYATRMAPQFALHTYIGGVSFGGILALEISRLVRPKGCIIISSVRNPRQLPSWFRIGRAIGGRRCLQFLRLLGDAATLAPRRIRTDSTGRIARISGIDGQWHRWAMAAVLDWQPAGDLGIPILHIHGDADRTFPLRYVNPDVVLHKGRHTLPVSHPFETANAIHAFTIAGR